MREQGLPKLQWPLAIVTKVFPGKDGIIRSVQLKTSKGLLCRSIQLLHDLEIACSSDYSSVSSDLEPVADDESIKHLVLKKLLSNKLKMCLGMVGKERLKQN